MRSIALILLLATLRTAEAGSDDDYSHFSNPLFGLSDAVLVKRQSCASGYNSCSNLGAANACCPSNTNCALDEAGHVACCPFNAVCTGTIAGTILGTITSTSSNFVLGGTTSTISSITTGVAGGGSTVPNAYYPFIYIPTSYANAALCSSAWSSCQIESTSCFTSLAGVNGVTVTGLGVGITVQGSSGTILSSASSICSSLSVSACYNLQETQCSVFGGGATATVTSGFVQPGKAGPRQTPCPGMLYAAGAGAVVGAVGALI